MKGVDKEFILIGLAVIFMIFAGGYLINENEERRHIERMAVIEAVIGKKCHQEQSND